MIHKINIVDYGIGNLFSVKRALEVCCKKTLVVSGKTQDILSSDLLILPGVGAFGDAIKELQKKDLIHPITKHVQNGKPILGICLGMQLLATSSEEFGSHDGLNFIPGIVERITNLSVNKEILKIPYIGWAKQELFSSNNTHKFLKNFQQKEMYTIHSFQFKPAEKKNLLAFYNYAGNQITSIVGHENITGVQFHPEKSGQVGLDFLNEYIKNIDCI